MSHLRRERLRQTARFVAIQQQGRWVRGQQLRVGVLASGLAVVRMGMRVERGVGTAVERNRAKRLLRQAFRQVSILPPGYDILAVILNTKHGRYCSDRMSRELHDALTKIVVRK